MGDEGAVKCNICGDLIGMISQFDVLSFKSKLNMVFKISITQSFSSSEQSKSLQTD